MDAFAVKEFLKDDSISHYIIIYHNKELTGVFLARIYTL